MRGQGTVERPWRGAVVIGVASIAMGIGYCFLYARLKGFSGLFYPADIWKAVKGAHYVQHGALGYIYESDSDLLMLPLFPILLTPLVTVGDALGLTEVSDYIVPFPSMWLLLAPFLGLTAIGVLYAGRRLVADLGGSGRSFVHLQVGLVALVVVPVWRQGHFEDLMALTAVMLAIVALPQTSRAALLIGVGIAFKQWALLALPALAAAVAGPSRAGFVARGLALPGVLAGFTLAVDWEHAAPQLLGARTFPKLGHAAPWSSGELLITSPFRLCILTIAIVSAILVRGRRETILGAVMVSFLARALFEPVVHPYYISPALAFLLVRDGQRRLPWRAILLGGALFSLFAWHPDAELWWAIYTASLLVVFVPSIWGTVRSGSESDFARPG